MKTMKFYVDYFVGAKLSWDNNKICGWCGYNSHPVWNTL